MNDLRFGDLRVPTTIALFCYKEALTNYESLRKRRHVPGRWRIEVRRLLTLVQAALISAAVAATSVASDPDAAIDALFEPHRVIDVQIELPPKKWDKVRFQSRSLFQSLQNRPAVKSPFSYSRGNVTIDGVRIEDVGIRKKGFLGSLDEVRPSLKIKFDKYVDQAPFGTLDRLTLNNNKQDPSCLSQFLSYKLFNQSGTVAPRCNLAKVTVNGQYLGIYSNVESMEPPLLERGFGDGSGELFEGTVADLMPAVVGKFEPKTDGAELSDLRAMAAILAEERLDIEQLEQLLDIDAFVKFWAMESLIGFWDGYTHNQNNFFIYRNPGNEKHYFMPWGTDSAFTYSIPKQIDKIRNKSFHSQSVLANRLYRNREVRELYRETLVDFLNEHWKEDRLLAEVDRVEKLLADDENSRSEFPKSVGKIRAFIEGRRETLEKELERWPIPLNRGARRPAYTERVGHGNAEFDTEWYAKSPSKPETRGEVTMELMLGDEQVSFRQVGGSAEPNKDWNVGRRNGQRPPTIVLTGIRDSDGKRLTLAMGLGADSFRPSKSPVGMFGVLIEGNMLAFLAKAIFNPMGLRMAEGKARFTRASMEPGEAVEGRMEFAIFNFAGGKSPRVPWEAD